MKKSSEALGILFEAIGYGVLHNMSYIKNIPGAVINKLGEKSRKILSTLKSDDIKNIRADQCYGTDEWYHNKENSELKIKFDEKCKK